MEVATIALMTTGILLLATGVVLELAPSQAQQVPWYESPLVLLASATVLIVLGAVYHPA